MPSHIEVFRSMKEKYGTKVMVRSRRFVKDHGKILGSKRDERRNNEQEGCGRISRSKRDEQRNNEQEGGTKEQ